MVLSSTASPDSRRHGQLVSPSSPLLIGNSKRNLTSKKPSSLSGLKASSSTSQSHSVRYREEDRVGDAMKELTRETEKHAISRRRILPTIAHEASLRTPYRMRAGGLEKENVVVKVGETPLRQARASRSAISSRSPSLNIVPSSIKVKPVHVTSGSTESKNTGLPRSSTAAKLSGRKPASIVAPRAIVNSRSAFVLEPSIRKNRDATSPVQDRVSAQAFLSAGSTWIDAERKTAPVSRLETVDTKSAVTLSKPCSYHSVPAVRDAHERPSAPGDSSDLVTFCDAPRSELVESLELRTDPDPLLSPSIQPMTPLMTSSTEESGTGLNHIAFPPSFGSPFNSAGDDKHASVDSTSDHEQDSFELVPLHDESKHACQADEEDEGASPTANTGDISEEASSTTLLSSILHTVIEDPIDSRELEEKEAESTKIETGLGMLVEQERGMNEAKAGFTNTDILQDVVAHSAKVVGAEFDDDDEQLPTVVATEPSSPAPQSPRPTAPIPPTPPSTPVGKPAASATPGSVPALPPSLFPRLFSELASTYAHLGFGGRPVSPLKNGAGPQAERTRQELASLRAGLGGSVLARARVFGSTIWSAKGVGAVEPSSPSSLSAQREVLEVGMAGPAGIRGSASNSGVVETPPASPSPASASASTSSVTPVLTPDGRSELKETRMMIAGKRILGCADAMRAVAMAQQLWKTKNFVTELK